MSLFVVSLVAVVATAGDLWVDVSPAPAGTPLAVDVHDVVGGVAIDVDVAGFFMEERSRDGAPYAWLDVPGCGGHGAVGEPYMPFQTVLVPVPNGPRATLTVAGSDPVSVLTGVTVVPQQPAQPDCGNPPSDFTIDDKAYGADSWFPRQSARIADDVVVRGQRFLVVEVHPLTFNPARKEVAVRSHLALTVDLVGQVDAAAEARKAERHSPLFPTAAVLDGLPAPDATPTGIEYLIVAYDPLVSAIEPLAEWKRKKGLTTEVVAMSTIGTTSADLKSFLQSRYDTDPDLTYVLLVGDHPMVPAQTLSGMVSDLYYSCLDGSDYFPDVVIGRISVQDPTDCEHVVDKILTFERDIVPGAWHGDYLMAAYLQDYNDYNCRADRFFFETGTLSMHFIRDEVGMGIATAATSDSLSCNPYTWREDATWYPHRPQGYAYQPVPQADADLITTASTSTQDITDAINAGVSLVQHRDHGGETGWGDPPYSNGNVTSLSNGDMTPIVYSVNCLTGTFNWSGGDCFAEAFMKKYPGGAVGVIAATTVSYSGHNDLLVRGAYDSFWDDFDTDDGGNIYPHSFRPAEAYMYGKYYMYHWEGPSSTTQIEFEMFHWHGDPEMRAFTAVPTTPGVTVDPTLPVGSSTLTVSVDVDGALVAVTDNGVLIGRAFASGGSAVVELDPPQTPATLDVVVSGHNLVPWQGTTEVIVPTGPWMTHTAHLCDDSSGDGDGIANPGETIVMPVTITNVGADDGTGIAGVLSSGSGHCTVTDAVADFPDAAVGASVQSLPDHYAFTLDGGTPNGEVVMFDLDWTASGGYSGSSTFSLPVCEHLVISDVALDFIGNDSAVVSWTTNVPATSQLVWGTITPITVIDGSGTGTAHSIEIEGLEPCTDYVFQVVSSSPDCYTEVDDNGGAYYGFETTAGSSVVVDSTDTPIAIPDNNATGASSVITVVSDYDVVDVDLLVNITHTWDGDLALSLIGPDGTTVLLSDHHGSSGDNYTDTHFDDDASTSIGSGSPPFTGSFQPDQPLAALNGQPAAGDWTFKVVDTAGYDTGNIESWQLQLIVNEPCDADAPIFADGFESGGTGDWSGATP
ncbi:MAG: C25 family cysteine peptidase [Holophagae bacterium]